ncbi:MAG: helix-turn-helix domain-containing protein [Phycisphaeraceae bacterium]|nr:helix-turn-helix domain-containing protein [Phycisphaeraceae bacterium]
MKPEPLVSRLLVKTSDAALMLQVSPRKLADLTARGMVPAVRIDGSVRYAVADLESFVRSLPRCTGRGAGGDGDGDVPRERGGK